MLEHIARLDIDGVDLHDSNSRPSWFARGSAFGGFPTSLAVKGEVGWRPRISGRDIYGGIPTVSPGDVTTSWPAAVFSPRSGNFSLMKASSMWKHRRCRSVP